MGNLSIIWNMFQDIRWYEFEMDIMKSVMNVVRLLVKHLIDFIHDSQSYMTS